MRRAYVPSGRAFADLTEGVSRLGQPDGIHRTKRWSIALNLVVGGLFLLTSILVQLLFWAGIIGWPNPRAIVAWKLLLLGIAVAPFLRGFVILIHLREWNIYVLTYPSGIVRWQGGLVQAFSWDEITSVRLRGLPGEASHYYLTPDGEQRSILGWSELSGWSGRPYPTTIEVIRQDGASATFSGTPTNVP